MAIKGYIGKAAYGLLFFFLIVALCPMNSFAEPKNRHKVPKRTPAAQAVQEPAAQNDAASKKEISREAESAISPTDEGNAGKGKEGESKNGVAGANGFQQYSDYRSEEVETESYGWLIFKTLIIIGLLVGGFYYFFRFVSKKTGIQLLGKDVAHVLSVVPLGQNRYLQVVDVAGKVLVLGVTDTNINFITEITEKDQIDRIRVMSSHVPAHEATNFSDFVSKQIGRFFEKRTSRNSHEPEVDEDRLEYLARQRERLKKIRGDIDGA